MRTVATAGHVDHGKSSLVLALTGTDPDRFPEEKARGLTIDLGFAFTRLPSGVDVGFVDVPGHVRFIKNMLAGVGAVEVALLVVAASEGWMPQSEEHLRILDLLGVSHGMVAITKADLVDDETLELAQLEVDDHLASSLLAGAPIVVCDSVSGRGIDDVRTTLDAALAAAPATRDANRPRLWVDRVFAAKGAGTVVTGTLTGGSFAVDDEVEVGKHRARVRGIETAGHRLGRAEPGARVALNLAGVEHRDVTRGDAVVRPDEWAKPRVIDVRLSVLPGEGLRRRGRFQTYIGSGEHRSWLRVLDDDTQFARLRLDTAMPMAPGDRLVVRDPGRKRTVAGAEVLDVEPAGRLRDAPPRLARPLDERLLASHPWLNVAAIPQLAGRSSADASALADGLVARGAAHWVGPWLVAPALLDDVRALATERVRAHHRDRPLEPGVELATLAAALRLDVDRLRAALDGAPELLVAHGIVRHDSHSGSAAESPEARQLVAALEQRPFAPPSPSEVGADTSLVRALVREGTIVDLDGVVFGAAALDQARALVVSALRERGQLTVAEVRDLLGSTRKYVVPIVGWLDREGVTRRRGDDRVPGPASGVA